MAALFGGPALAQPVPDAPLSLEESIRLALHANGDPNAAARSFEAARQNVASARAAYAPEITANLNSDYRNSRNGSNNSNNSSNSTSTTTRSNNSSTFVTSGTSSNVTVSQNIFDAGRIRQRVNQASARAVGAAGSYGGTRNSLAYEVASAFFEQLRQQKLVAQRAGQVALAARQLEAIQAQIEAGTVARADAQTVQVNLSQARFDLVTARNNLNSAQTNFRNTLGLTRGPALRLQESSLAVETGLPAPDSTTTTLPTTPDGILNAPLPKVPVLAPLDDFVAQAARLRPDLVQSRADVQSGEAAVKLAQIETKPQITASASYNIDPRQTGTRGFNLGAGVSIPVFDGGGRRADVKAAQADLEANRLRLAQLQKDVAADVETSFVEIGGQVERLANARVLVEQARVNLENASEKYRLGLGTVLDVTNAQTLLFNAQTSLTGAVYDYELARANLDRSVGRFAWADPGGAPPQTAPQSMAAAIRAVNATQK